MTNIGEDLNKKPI